MVNSKDKLWEKQTSLQYQSIRRLVQGGRKLTFVVYGDKHSISYQRAFVLKYDIVVL